MRPSLPLPTSMLVLSLVAIEPALAQWMGAGVPFAPSIGTVPRSSAAQLPASGSAYDVGSPYLYINPPADGPKPLSREHSLLARQDGLPNNVLSLNKLDAVDDPELMALTELELRELLNGRDRAVVRPAVGPFDVDFAETITVHSVSRREERITEAPAAVTEVPDEQW